MHSATPAGAIRWDKQPVMACPQGDDVHGPQLTNGNIPRQVVKDLNATHVKEHLTSSKNANPVSLPQNPSQSQQPRLLTVDEALQYSPFSSIIPFNPQAIPIPSAAHLSSASLLDSGSFGEAARQQLSRIDEELLRCKGNSALAIEAYNELRPLLDKDDLTVYELKEKRSKGKHAQGKGQAQTNGSREAILGEMSPFARMVYNGSNVEHQIGSSNTPAIVTPKTRTTEPPLIKQTNVLSNHVPSRPYLPTPIVEGERIVQNNTAIARNNDIPVAPKSPPLTPSRQQPMVLVAPLPQQINRNEYKPIREESLRITTPNSSAATFNQDHKSVAEGPSQRLQSFLSDLLDPESCPNRPAMFHNLEDGQEVLSNAALDKLVPLIQKAASFNRLQGVPLSHLTKLHELCASAVMQHCLLDSNMELSIAEDRNAEWNNSMLRVSHAIRSARVIIRIMEGCPGEKSLHSEELMQKVVGLINGLTQSCIVPILECRSNNNTSLFDRANEHKAILSQAMQQLNKCLSAMTTLMAKIELPETIINSIEYLALQLLFAEVTYSDKESIFGLHKVESLRRVSMDVISEIFTRYHEQRTAILDEILTSLQKLPISRQHARNFRLKDGSNIQLVSALIMNLIQTTATSPKHTRARARVSRESRTDSKKRKRDLRNGHDASEVLSESTDDDNDDPEPDEDVQKEVKVQWHLRRLAKKAAPLCDEALKMTSYVVRFFVSRAATTPKSGDQPHRHLLDIFCEDLLSVVDHPEWPASEILLRVLLIHMVDIAEKPNHAAPAKAMALEILGQMGSAISGLVARTRSLTRTVENTPKNIVGFLAPIFEDYFASKVNASDLYEKAGVYNMVLDYMQSESPSDDQLNNACGFYLAFYVKAFAAADLDADSASLKYLGEIDDALSGNDWLVYHWGDATPIHRRLAYSITVLNMDFFRQFDRIMKLLLDSIASDQVTVRNKSLKSVTVMLEREPALLERAGNVKALIMRCASDRSPQVRDSALQLIGKCLELRPALEQEFRRTVLMLSDDTSLSVRKRSIKLLKEMFLRQPSSDVQAAISEPIIKRTMDIEKSVSELARQTFLEIWLAPFLHMAVARDRNVSDKLSLIKQINIMIQTVKRGEPSISNITALLSHALSKMCKDHGEHSMVCKALVDLSLDIMLNAEAAPHEIERKDVLPLLTVFAKSDPKLFTADQLQHLQPYISNIVGTDDLSVFRSAVVIFRNVLPALPDVRSALLTEVQGSLLQCLGKIPLPDIDEVAACLWTIDGKLKNTERLIRLTSGVIKNLKQQSKIGMADQKEVMKTKKYIKLAGAFGQYCDFEAHKAAFGAFLPGCHIPSIAGLLVSSILPFTGEAYPLPLRREAYHGIGAVCQRWPYQYNQSGVGEIFQDVLNNGESMLQSAVLGAFRDFFLKQERQAEVKLEEQAVSGKKLGASMTASDSDEASALIAQRFLKDISNIALASDDATAFAATEVVTSINRQGLVHPKESAPALVALETSTNPAIAQIAYKAHLRLHEQHESMFEREYTRAVHEAFIYQKDIAKDMLGYTTNPLSAKLHSLFEVINTSNAKYQQKFITNFCARIDFDVSKLDVSNGFLPQLAFARFLIENLALFEYVRLDEVQHTVTCMERIVTGTGTSLAHTISVELSSFLNQSPEGLAREENLQQAPDDPPASQLDPVRLRQLSAGAVILACLWDARTHLKRLYGLNGGPKRTSKGKPSAKDFSAAPNKVSGIDSERVISSIAQKVKALDIHETMLVQCKEFVELMTVDSEVKVAEEGEDDMGELGTPSGDEEEAPMPASGGSRKLKRKGSESVNGTPQKKRGRPTMGRRKSTKRDEEGEDWE